jgi:hypothetical protein
VLLDWRENEIEEEGGNFSISCSTGIEEGIGSERGDYIRKKVRINRKVNHFRKDVISGNDFLKVCHQI